MHTSKYALSFYSIVQGLDATLQDVHGIIWDWFDVPDSDCSNHKMHIDATVFLGSSCIRFEIDGETHFKDNLTSRLHTDEQKDDVLREAGVGMLRLHYMDTEQWPLYVKSALQHGVNTVQYTASYRQCLHPEEYQYIMSI